MAKLTKQDIKKLQDLYDKGGNFEYEDLTPNLQAYADWCAENLDEITALAHTNKFSYWGGNSFDMAFNKVAKYDKPPRVGYNTKAEVDENDFTCDIWEKIKTGAWN